ASINGIYNALVSSANFTNTINAVNGVTGTTGTTGTQAGLGGSPNSLSGQTPALGRFYFDGSGNIVGNTSATSTLSLTVGSYAVVQDCTGTMKLNSGQNFDIVVAAGGDQVLFIQTDASGGGAIGTLQRSAPACAGVIVPYFSGAAPDASKTYAFSAFGAQSAA